MKIKRRQIIIMEPSDIKYIKIHCVNCGRLGHKFTDCTEPVISLGIIAMYRSSDHNEYNEVVTLSDYHKKILDSIDCKCNKRELKPKILLVQRKHTMGYIDFVRSKYPKEEPERSNMINIFLSEMVKEELSDLYHKDFDDIWDELWLDIPVENNDKIPYYIQDRGISKEKFNKLERREYIKPYLDNPRHTYCEFEIPKGRREIKETDIDCAKREFREETGYSEKDYTILNDKKPLYEIFTATNGINYKHIYYIAKLNRGIKRPATSPDNHYQESEINSIGLFTQKEALSVLRNYNVEKKKIIKLAFKKFEQYNK